MQDSPLWFVPRSKQRNEPDPLSFSKFIIVVSFVLLIVYTSVVLVIFARTGLEPETMTRYFVNAIIGEFSLLGTIKVVKVVMTGRSKKVSEECCTDENDSNALS